MDERMPDADVYEEELRYMPYIHSLNFVRDVVLQQTPIVGDVLDVMCGTGYVLSQIGKRSRGLELHGVDIDSRYISFAKQYYPRIKFEVGDVRHWQPDKKYDTIVCTGALHHLTDEEQPKFIARLPSMLKPNGFVVVADCYIDNYATEQQRQLGAARLGYEYLSASIRNGSTDQINGVLIDIMRNDVLRIEHKTSLAKRVAQFEQHFASVETTKIWPSKRRTKFGDYVSILR